MKIAGKKILVCDSDLLAQDFFEKCFKDWQINELRFFFSVFPAIASLQKKKEVDLIIFRYCNAGCRRLFVRGLAYL
jgi:hypothetical protein